MQVRVSPTINTILDEAATISVRRGKYYVGVEHLFEALVSGGTHIPPSIAREDVQVLQQVAKVVQGEDWRGVPPSVAGDVFYTPRCADLTNEAARLAERLHSDETTGAHLLLTEAVINAPFSILLFDEIEKADPKIFDIFLPILDEGRLKDSNGRMVSFKNCIIIFTSNVGAEVLGETPGSEDMGHILDELRRHFRPEFINRIDEIVPFYPLLFEDVRAILRTMIDGIRNRLKDKDMGIRMYQRAYEFLGEKGYSRDFGARELKRAVERHIADPISEHLLAGDFQAGDMIDVKMEDGALSFSKGAPSSKKGSKAP